VRKDLMTSRQVRC